MATAKTTATKATAKKETSTKTTSSKKTTTSKATTSKKTSSAKTTTAKKPAAKTSASKKTTTAKSTGTSVKLTATEKKLLDLYRAADADTKKAAMALLKGEKSQLGEILDSILENKTIMNTVTSLFK
jgi:hypothetical protein